MNRDNLMTLTVAQLRVFAREELKMTGISKLKKSDLVDAIIKTFEKNQKESSKVEPIVTKEESVEIATREVKKFMNRKERRRAAAIARKNNKSFS
ncbi:MAG: transcription termination factor Rho [Caudoviricetes sp.]|nr:MAG: transcription termination factor Rho [Caudoviricetes sp.]